MIVDFYILYHCCPVKFIRFFASLLMTALCVDYSREEVGWWLRRQPTSSQKPN